MPKSHFLRLRQVSPLKILYQFSIAAASFEIGFWNSPLLAPQLCLLISESKIRSSQPVFKEGKPCFFTKGIPLLHNDLLQHARRPIHNSEIKNP